MFNLDNVTIKNDDKEWPYRILIRGPSGSGKSNALFNLIQQDNNSLTRLICMLKINTMDDVYNNIDDYNAKRKRKVLIVFDDMIPDIMTNKKFQAIIKELFIRCRKLTISLVFITQSYFSVPKEVRLNSTYYLIMKIHNRRELRQIAINHLAETDYKYF